MVQLSSRVAGMQASPIRKLTHLSDAAERKGIRVYHLNIGQPDIPTPPNYWKAIRDCEPRVLAYGPSQGLQILRKAISGYYSRGGITVSEDSVMITTGGSEAVYFALMAACGHGDEVICFEPFYTNYNGFADMAGVKLVPVTSSVENGFHLPPRKEIEALITRRTRAILICSPNNPTGTVLGTGELAMLSDIVRKHNLFLLSDEVYRDFVFDGGKHTSVLEFPEIADRVMVMDSISKRFSSCGARLGNLICLNPEVMGGILKLGQARLCPPTMAQYGAAWIYEHLKETYYSDVAVTYQRRRDVLMEELKGVPGVFFLKPEGAFYATIRIPVDDGDRFAAWLLSDFSVDGATVMVSPAAGFYATPGLGADEIRLAFVLNEEDMRVALRILKKGLEAYPGAL
jgi:aspartate aminotransferase